MNRVVRLARFEVMFENARKPSRAKFQSLFRDYGFTDDEFNAWQEGREWSE